VYMLVPRVLHQMVSKWSIGVSLLVLLAHHMSGSHFGLVSSEKTVVGMSELLVARGIFDPDFYTG
jgi:hypothetical protein